MMVISEGSLDDFFGIPRMPSHIFIPGCNIKTGCYGLFLVALDQCEDTTERASLEEAQGVLDSIKNCVLSSALLEFYPLSDMSYEGIVKLADAIILIADHASDTCCSKVSGEAINTVMTGLDELLPKRQEMIKL